MAGIKSLAKDTVIYGSSSIIGKFLNWLLVPYYVRVLARIADYGIVTNIYGYTALLTVLLTYGMETGFFRFANKKEEDPTKVYSTTMLSVGLSSILFVLLFFWFLNPISSAMGYAGFEEYLGIMFTTVAVDAFMSIPFAYLRYKNRPIRFAAIKMLFVFMNIVFNIFFLSICPIIYKHHPELISWFYRPDYGVGYIFWSNLLATCTQFLFLLPEIRAARFQLDFNLLKRILKYSLPLLVLGLAGIMNQTIDKIIFPFLYNGTFEEGQTQLGIYGACFKIAVVMVMFTQAFRFAYEPFFFANNKNRDDRQVYADVMKYFIIFSLIIFLCVMFYMDLIKRFVTPEYYDGIRVVPIVMIGMLFFGIYFNLSLWYKLTDETKWGAYFSTIGFVIMVAVMVIFVPHYGYMAAAWGSFIAYLITMLLSYFIGQKKYPIKYDLKTIGLHFALALILYAVSLLVHFEHTGMRLGFNTLLLIIYLFVVIKRDLPLSQIPYLSKLITPKSPKGDFGE